MQINFGWNKPSFNTGATYAWKLMCRQFTRTLIIVVTFSAQWLKVYVLLGLYVVTRRRSPGQRKKPVWIDGEWLPIESRDGSNIRGRPSCISVESWFNYRTLARLFARPAVSFLAWVHVWIETNVERISCVDLSSTPCATTWFSFVLTAWIIDEGLRWRTSTYKLSICHQQ